MFQFYLYRKKIVLRYCVRKLSYCKIYAASEKIFLNLFMAVKIPGPFIDYNFTHCKWAVQRYFHNNCSATLTIVKNLNYYGFERTVWWNGQETIASLRTPSYKWVHCPDRFRRNRLIYVTYLLHEDVLMTSIFISYKTIVKVSQFSIRNKIVDTWFQTLFMGYDNSHKNFCGRPRTAALLKDRFFQRFVWGNCNLLRLQCNAA